MACNQATLGLFWKVVESGFKNRLRWHKKTHHVQSKHRINSVVCCCCWHRGSDIVSPPLHFSRNPVEETLLQIASTPPGVIFICVRVCQNALSSCQIKSLAIGPRIPIASTNSIKAFLHEQLAASFVCLSTCAVDAQTQLDRLPARRGYEEAGPRTPRP